MSSRARKAPIAVPVRRHGPSARASSVEWAGTRLPAPPDFAVRDVAELDFIFWMNGAYVVAAAPVDRTAPLSAMAEVLRDALASGKAPPPQRLRVSDPRAVASVVALVGAGVPVAVGPVPEAAGALAELAEALSQARSQEAGSPLEEIVDLAEDDPALVARFFTAAAALYRLGPWNLVPSDSDVLRVDAPAVGLRDACVSVVGQIRESYGLLCFDSAETFMAFLRAARGASLPAIPPALAVQFDAAKEMPPEFLAEIRRRRWPLAGPAGVPWLMCSSPEGLPRAVTREDVLRAAVLLEAVTRFLEKHGDAIFDELARCSERYELDGALGKTRVIVEHPHPAYRDASDDDADAALGAPTDRDTPEEAATARFLHDWQDRDLREHRDEFEAALREAGFALLGRTFTRDDGPGLSPHLGTSLLPTWATLFRPRKSGRTGLDDAARDRSATDASSRAARLRLAKARVILADVLSVDRAAGTVLMEDVFDHCRYTVLGWGGAQLEQLTRWARGFGLILPRDDGRWIFPSVFSVADHFAEVDPARFVAAVRSTLAALKKPVASVDPAAPSAGLRLHWGIAYGVLVRMGEEVLAAQKPKRVFLGTSEGDCVEFCDVVVKLKTAVATVASRMRAAGDMVETGERRWSWMASTPSPLAPGGEDLGSLAREGRQWVVRASSPARVERLFDRIEAIVGERPKEVSRTVRAPWKEDGFARRKEEADETVVISNRPVEVASPEEAMSAVVELTEQALRDSLDRELPAVGGVPRQRVATAEGRAAVEAWLRGLERRGQAEGMPGGRMLDLDPIRRELGMPTVAG
jgi:hypothetical protein